MRADPAAVQDAPSLEIVGLRAGYARNTWVVEGVSLHVAPGQVLAVVGPNGAGKSTLLKGIMRLVPYVDGVTRLDGSAVDVRSGHEMARRGVALVHEGRGVLNSLTVEDNLQLAAKVARASHRSSLLVRTYEQFPVLSDRRHQSAGLLSGGEQQMLAISRAVMMEPSVILMDEPSLGLAPQILSRIARLVAGLREDGLAVLLVEQNVEFCRKAGAERTVVLRRGAIVHEGELDSPIGRRKIEAAYMGSEDTGKGEEPGKDLS